MPPLKQGEFISKTRTYTIRVFDLNGRVNLIFG
jgi:hypothetical protein